MVAEFFDQQGPCPWHGHLFVKHHRKQITYSRWPQEDEWYHPEEDPEELETVSPREGIPKEYLEEAERLLEAFVQNKEKASLLRAYGVTRASEKTWTTTSRFSFEGKGPKPLS